MLVQYILLSMAPCVVNGQRDQMEEKVRFVRNPYKVMVLVFVVVETTQSTNTCPTRSCGTTSGVFDPGHCGRRGPIQCRSSET